LIFNPTSTLGFFCPNMIDSPVNQFRCMALACIFSFRVALARSKTPFEMRLSDAGITVPKMVDGIRCPIQKRCTSPLLLRRTESHNHNSDVIRITPPWTVVACYVRASFVSFHIAMFVLPTKGTKGHKGSSESIEDDPPLLCSSITFMM